MLYNINETDAADVEAVHTTDCEPMRNSRTTVMSNENDRDITFRQSRRRAPRLSFECGKHSGADGQLVMFPDWCTGTIAWKVCSKNGRILGQ